MAPSVQSRPKGAAKRFASQLLAPTCCERCKQRRTYGYTCKVLLDIMLDKVKHGSYIL